MKIKNFMPSGTKAAPKAFWWQTGLALGAALFLAVSGRAQTNFASAQVISGYWGSVTNSNTNGLSFGNAPVIAGSTAYAPVWYQWTAPVDGVVEMDTVGSCYQTTNILLSSLSTNLASDTFTTNTSYANIDTVLGVYTGTSLQNLNQVAANDDLFPLNGTSRAGQDAGATLVNESYSADYIGLGPLNGGGYFDGTGEGFIGGDVFDYIPPYYGPSGLRFNAVGGQTYYIVVDPKNPFQAAGPLVLNWAYQSSGVFRFASEDFDGGVTTSLGRGTNAIVVNIGTGLPLYQAAETESQYVNGGNNTANSVVLTYYNYNAPGVLVTVTRVAGSTGRAWVDYSTFDGTNLANFNDQPGVADTDYIPVAGTLIFDDFEMSKTILIPIINRGQVRGDQTNRVFGVQLSNPQLDYDESGNVSTPRVDPVLGTAVVRILNSYADPYGPDMVAAVTAVPPGSTNYVTNNVVADFPTNCIFNFQKTNFRVPADVNDPTTSPWNQVTLWVERFGTNSSAEQFNYRVNNVLDGDQDVEEEENIYFPLQPGSDYAVPTPPNVGPIRGTNSDFVMTQGTVSFPSSGSGYSFQPITFTVPTNTLTRFNKDFKVQIYQEQSINNNTVPRLLGMINETTVTILFNDENPPAGSVDELYNADFNSELALYAANIPQTVPANDPFPGVGLYGEVYAMTILSNNECMIGGDFQSFNGLSANGISQSCIALVTTNGQLDTSFYPGSGANAAVDAVASYGSQFYLGGSFTSINGANVGRIARLNANGTIDSSFAPGVGANGTVRAMAVLPNGEVLIGGDFTQVGNLACNYIALLKANGAVDTSFNPGNNINGSVYALALQPGGTNGPQVLLGGSFSVAGQTYQNIARLNLNGAVDPTFNPGTGPDSVVHSLAIEYEGTILAAGEFTHFNGTAMNRFAQLSANGSPNLTNFFMGTGADATVFCINPMTVTTSTNYFTNTITGTVFTNYTYATGGIYIGGAFDTINGTHRLGFARLYANGTVDTTFMDTAYNQFAGLKRVFSYDDPAVLATAIQNDGNVLIGGSFNQVGGGQASTNVCETLDDEEYIYPSFGDPNLWVEPKSRDGVRNRTGLARLIGGATPGAGNIGFVQSSYSANKSQSSLSVAMVRTNGLLGPGAVNFGVIPNLAQSGVDYGYDAAPPIFWTASQFTVHPSRERSDGLYGNSGFLEDPYGLFLTLSDTLLNQASEVTVSIINNKLSSGDLDAGFQLANPSDADTFYLGGENIPLGTALGISSAPLTIVDDTSYPGQFGFSSSTFIGTGSSAEISVVRSNGVYGAVTMKYWATNGTALAGTDYVGLTNQPMVFNPNQTTNGFAVSIKNNGYSANVEKTVNLSLNNLATTPGATFGISNAILRLINPSFQGYITLSASNYTGTISAGVLNFVVSRITGSLGTLTIQYATANGTATNGIDYMGSTNTLTWNSGDVSPRAVSIPLLNPGVVGTNKQFAVSLFNPTANGSGAPSLFGLITNATLVISNNNNAGTLQFASPSYLVNSNGGYATINVIRTGGSVGTVSAQFATSNGTATNGLDYVATNGTLTLGPGQISTSFAVPIIYDPTGALPLYFNASLIGSSGLTNTVVNIVGSSGHAPGTLDTLFNTNGVNGDVFAVALQTNGQIVIGGNFTAVGPTPESQVARLNTDGSLDTTFLNGLAGANGPVSAVTVQSDGRILIGGGFSSVDGITRSYIARLMTDGSLDTSFNPGGAADNSVNTISETFIGGVRRVYVGGNFIYFNGSYTPGIVRLEADITDLNNDGSVDPSFNVGSGLDGQVYAVAAYPTNSLFAGQVLVGGSFAHYNGAAATNLIRLNVDGSLDTTFVNNLGNGPSDMVESLAIQLNGQILVGGRFTSINGTPANHLCRLNANGTLDASFLSALGAGADASVLALQIQPDNRIILAGSFAHVNGVTLNHISRLLPTGAVDGSINFGSGANGDIYAAVVQPADDNIVIGGAFTEYNGMPTPGIARIYGGSETGSGAFTFASASYQVNEDGLLATIPVLRTGGLSGPNADGSGTVSVQFTASGGTAVPGVNYIPVSDTLSFAPGQTEDDVQIYVLHDSVITPNLSVNLALSNPTPPATDGNQNTAILTIINVDNAIAFDSAVPTVQKAVNTGRAQVEVDRLGGSVGTNTVDYQTTTNGTAVIGTDYYPTNGTLTFAPGQTNAYLYVPIINNTLTEGNQTVNLVLTNLTGNYSMFTSPSNVFLTILQGQSGPGQLYFAQTNFTAYSGDGYAYLTVLRTNGDGVSVSVGATAIPGTALPGVNYNPAISGVTFPVNATNAIIRVGVETNSLIEPPVSLNVYLNAPSGGATLTLPTNTILTIINTNVGFLFQSATNYVRETNGYVPIYVERVGSTSNSASVNYSTAPGTALPGVNYTPVSGTLAFAPGENLAGISLPLIYDPKVTGNLLMTVQLSSPGAGTLLGYPSNSVIVIQDADAGVSFTNSVASYLKNVGVAMIPVVCTNTAVEPVLVNTNVIPMSVHYATADGTALAGQDYQATSGTLYFTNGIGTNFIAVPIINNSRVVGNLNFTVSLMSPTVPAQLVPPSEQTVTIVDHNSGLSFSSPVYTVLKTGVYAPITVQRTDFTATNSSVYFSTADGTAVGGLDYVATNGLMVFTNNQTSQSFDVWVIDNTAVQPDKTVLLQLSGPTNGFLIAPYASTLTIHDTSGSLVVPAGSALIAENLITNGIIDPGETVTLLLGLRASGGTNVNNLSATLVASNGVASPTSPNGTPTQKYGNLIVEGPSVSRPFTFTAHGTNGQTIAATLLLTNGTSGLGTAVFTYTLGTWTNSFYNSNSIIINDFAIASPYPSEIAVSNLGGVLVRSTVTLTNLYHGFTKDIEALVVSPAGSDTMLMGHAGNGNVSGITLTFDDLATNSLPANSVLVTGTNKPTTYSPITPFP